MLVSKYFCVSPYVVSKKRQCDNNYSSERFCCKDPLHCQTKEQPEQPALINDRFTKFPPPTNNNEKMNKTNRKYSGMYLGSVLGKLQVTGTSSHYAIVKPSNIPRLPRSCRSVVASLQSGHSYETFQLSDELQGDIVSIHP